MDDMNKLSKVFNVSNKTNDDIGIPIIKQKIIVKGVVVVMLADTQVAHSIGGFKVSVVFALQKCCDCLTIEEIMKYKLSTFKTT